MSHDRARLSALVDGELDHDARDRVLAHLAQCDECRAVVETERRVKSLLSGMPEASPGGDFLARLNSLGDPNAEPVIEPPAPARRRIVGRGRSAGSKRSGTTTRPMPPTAQVAESGQTGAGPLAGSRTRLGALRLRTPVAGALMAEGGATGVTGVTGEATADESGADELGAGVRAPGGFPLGVLRVGEQRTEASAPGFVRPGELSADETATAEVRAGEPYAAATGSGAKFGEAYAGEMGAASGAKFGEAYAGELSTAGEAKFGQPSAGEMSTAGVRRSRGPFGAPTRPAASRPFGYPDLHGSRRPGRLRGGRLRSSRLGRRFTVGVAGAASIAGMALVTAFTVGGAGAPTTADVKVVPPIQRYTVQHADSVVNLPYADPGGATASIGDSNLTGLLSPNR